LIDDEENDKPFDEMTDEEVLELCKKDENGIYHSIYDSIEPLQDDWNNGVLFFPDFSYMGVIQ
jgi:hypothetical protein